MRSIPPNLIAVHVLIHCTRRRQEHAAALSNSGSDGNADAASGIVNAAHQLGNSLGQALLIAASRFAFGTLVGVEPLTHRLGNAMTTTASTVALALVVVFTMIIRRTVAATH